jgi:transcriptional regulator NrdR
MHCPFCGADNTQVTDTRENEDGDTVRRRRRCLSCDKRFTTYERIDLKMPQVVKKNGSRTDYDRDKLKGSLSWPCASGRSPPRASKPRSTASKPSWSLRRTREVPPSASANW